MSDDPAAAEWPAYSNFGSKDHLHALGVIGAVWNSMEGWYQAFIQQIFPYNVASAIKVFQLLGNDSRWQLIKDELIPKLPAEEGEALDYFLKCGAICKENRNAVMHGKSFSLDLDKIGMNKGSAKGGGVLKQYHFDLAGLRQMADESYAVHQYALHFFASIQIRMSNESWAGQPHVVPTPQLPLPEKPPQPRKWYLHNLKPAEGASPQQPSSAPISE